MARQFKPGQLQTGSLYNISSSYAVTASYAMNGGGGSAATFPYSGSAVITGSLLVSGSGITGNLFGTASYATYAETASIATRTTQTDVLVLNQSGNTIQKGVVVRITGSGNQSDIPRIATASIQSDAVSANTLGITTQLIANGDQGYVITEGVLTGIDTSAFTSGQLLYLGLSGSILGTPAIAPNHTVRLGEVVRSQQNNGSIYVRIDNGYEIDELHDVLITGSAAGDLLIRSASVWINSKQLTGSYGLTGSLTATSFTGSLQGTASFAQTSSYVVTAQTASYVQNSVSASYVLNAVSSSYSATASYVLNAVSASRAVTASYVLNAVSASYAQIFPYTGSAIISGSLTVTGSTNLLGTTGTTLFSSNADTLIISGSLIVTGSSILTGSLNVRGGITASLFGTSSWSVTASQAITASYSLTASYIDGGFY